MSWNRGKSAILDWMRSHVAHLSDECLKWPFSGNWNGYGHVKFRDKIMKAHRVMCILAHGEPPTPKHLAAHSCNNGHEGCVNPKHLSWKTPRENMLDRVAAGTLTKKRWAKNRPIITDELRARICALKGTKNQREIAAMFDISYQSVSLVQRGLRRQPKREPHSR